MLSTCYLVMVGGIPRPLAAGSVIIIPIAILFLAKIESKANSLGGSFVDFVNNLANLKRFDMYVTRHIYGQLNLGNSINDLCNANHANYNDFLKAYKAICALNANENQYVMGEVQRVRGLSQI